MGTLKLVAFALFAVVVGFFAMSIFFNGTGLENLPSRVAVAVIIFLVSGIIIGYFNQDAWVLAGITAWGGALLGAIGIMDRPTNIAMVLAFLAPSLGPAFLGGYLGAVLARKHPVSSVFVHLFGRHRVKNNEINP